MSIGLMTRLYLFFDKSIFNVDYCSDPSRKVGRNYISASFFQIFSQCSKKSAINIEESCAEELEFNIELHNFLRGSPPA